MRTYIASGNVIFKSKKTPSQVKSLLESSLEKYAKKSVGIIIRTASEMREVLEKNPFPNAAPNRTVAIFLDDPPLSNALDNVTGLKDEQMQIGKCEIYVYYGSGMGNSKLKIPAAKNGTARNINTIAKLTDLATV